MPEVKAINNSTDNQRVIGSIYSAIEYCNTSGIQAIQCIRNWIIIYGKQNEGYMNKISSDIKNATIRLESICRDKSPINKQEIF